MDRAKIRRHRSRLPLVVNELIFDMQRKSLIRAIGSFHAAWAELEWRIWALDTADYHDGTFHPIATFDPRTFLKKSKAHQPVSRAIKRLKEKLDLEICLDELSKRRNRIIHGTISPQRYTASSFRNGPVLMSSRILGFTWVDRHPIPTLISVTEGELERYRDFLEKSDVCDLTTTVSKAIRELDSKYLGPLFDELKKPDGIEIDDEVVGKLLQYPLEESAELD